VALHYQAIITSHLPDETNSGIALPGNNHIPPTWWNQQWHCTTRQ